MFLEDSPTPRRRPLRKGEAPTANHVTELSNAHGLALNEAFMRIKQSALRRIILNLVQQIARIGA